MRQPCFTGIIFKCGLYFHAVIDVLWQLAVKIQRAQWNWELSKSKRQEAGLNSLWRVLRRFPNTAYSSFFFFLVSIRRTEQTNSDVPWMLHCSSFHLTNKCPFIRGDKKKRRWRCPVKVTQRVDRRWRRQKSFRPVNGGSSGLLLGLL